MLEDNRESKRVLRGIKVLVVEDDWITSRFICEVLRTAKAEIIGPFSDVAKAIAAIAAEEPHVAILDLRLDTQLVDRVATALAASNIPYVVATGYHILPTWADTNSKAVLRKPLDGCAIIRAISDAYGGFSAD